MRLVHDHAPIEVVATDFAVLIVSVNHDVVALRGPVRGVRVRFERAQKWSPPILSALYLRLRHFLVHVKHLRCVDLEQVFYALAPGLVLIE